MSNSKKDAIETVPSPSEVAKELRDHPSAHPQGGTKGPKKDPVHPNQHPHQRQAEGRNNK